ncbi:MAG TPA: biotin/lipoyl-containing protein [Candidatus Limnocylindrales bacterium]|nr:biotin/lipoyl-containing protein [Candidatus Limnocylindrales bacterium]
MTERAPRRRLRVTAAPGALAGDEPRELDIGIAGDVRVVRSGPGRIEITGPNGVSRVALIGWSRRLPSGATRVEVVVDGWRFELDVEDAARAELRRRATRADDVETASGPAEVRAIIPGRVAAVRVTAGDRVEAGQTLLVVEAMKMQNELRATRAGTVEQVAVGEGDTIDTGDVLVVVR